MLVKDIMTQQVVAIEPEMPIADVHVLMEQRNIRHFPIVEREKLIGIVSDRDIRLVGSEHKHAPEAVKLSDCIREIMAYPVLTAHPLDAIEEAAKVLRENKIGAMPVMQDDVLVGIVTGIDFLDALVKMTGVYGSSSRLELELDNRPGVLALVLTQIAKQGVNVSSVMTKASDDNSVCFTLRVNTINARGLANILRDEGHTVLWPGAKL